MPKGLLLIATVAAAYFMSASVFAGTLEHSHPPEDEEIHNEFYSKWKHKNGGNCCNEKDCYPTAARYNEQTKLWEALRREDRNWIEIPQRIFDPEKDSLKLRSPDGRSHLCAPEPPIVGVSTSLVDVYCFVPGTGM